MTIRPSGTLIQKIHCQVNLATIRPPRAGPTISASPPIPLQIPKAFPRFATGTAAVKIAIDIGVMTEAPIPAMTRATINNGIRLANAQNTEPSVKTKMPRL